MRTFFLFFSCLIAVSATAQTQSVKEILCSDGWQENQTSIVWTFTDSGTFSAVRFWLNPPKKEFGFTLKKGTFQLTDSAKTLQVLFDSTFNMYSKDSFLIRKDTNVQVWNLVTVTANKLVISRPPVWDAEKRRMTNDGQRMLITWKREKKKKDSKQKT